MVAGKFDGSVKTLRCFQHRLCQSRSEVWSFTSNFMLPRLPHLELLLLNSYISCEMSFQGVDADSSPLWASPQQLAWVQLPQTCKPNSSSFLRSKTKKPLKQSWLLAFWKKIQDTQEIERMLFNWMQISKEVLFFKLCTTKKQVICSTFLVSVVCVLVWSMEYRMSAEMYGWFLKLHPSK